MYIGLFVLTEDEGDWECREKKRGEVEGVVVVLCDVDGTNGNVELEGREGREVR